MIAEKTYIEWIKIQLEKNPFSTPSALALKSYYVADTEGWKFTDLRAIAEQTKKIHMQKLKA